MSDEEKKQEEKKQALVRRDAMPVTATIPGVFRLQPRTFEDYWNICSQMASSDLVPLDYKGKPANIMIAMEYGASIGIPNIQAPQVIAVINGRPSLWGDGFLGVIQTCPAYEWHQEDFDEKKQEWTCKIKRKGNPKPFVGTFGKKDAETIMVNTKNGKIPLIKKPGPWSDGYWKRMCQMRARGFAGRDGFSDWLRGIVPAEEAQDMASIEAEFTHVEPDSAYPEMPQSTDKEPPDDPGEEAEAFEVPGGEAEAAEADVMPPDEADTEPEPAEDPEDPKVQAQRRLADFEELFKQCESPEQLNGTSKEFFKYMKLLKETQQNEIWHAAALLWNEHKKRLGIKT